MRKTLLMFSLVVLTCIPIYAMTRRALVIGIGDYPEESGWGKINGDKDIPVVVEMLMANGFQKQYILTLVDAQASKKSIQTAIETLIAQSEQGDNVYIHFSGHGQQVVDENGDEEDGLDEAWIPFDARAIFVENQYEGENHILDDELNVWFSAIKEKIGKQGQLVVVADACHSGGGSRGAEEDTICIRGNFSVAWVERQMDRLKDIVDVENFLNQISTQIFTRPSSSRTQVRAESHPIDWVFISACKGYQTNQEYRKSGSLTMALFQIRDRMTQLSYSDLRLSIKRWMDQNLPKTQTPTIDIPQNETSSALFQL